MQRELATELFEVLDRHVTAQGTSKPERLRVRMPRGEGPVTLYVKWKPAPEDGEASNNSPRRELAAYELQKILFAQRDWIVPPTAVRCLSRTEYAEILQDAPTWKDADCVLGMLAYWVPNTTEMGPVDPLRFETDPEYRRALSVLNVFTYVVAHRDSVGRNFLVPENSDRYRIFSVDNGMTFGAFARNPLSWFSDDWLEIRLTYLDRAVVDRLRSIERDDLETLAMLVELRKRDGVYEHVGEPGPVFDRSQGIRTRGDRMQLGLTPEEIGGVYDRVQELLEHVDRGAIEVGPKPARAHG